MCMLEVSAKHGLVISCFYYLFWHSSAGTANKAAEVKWLREKKSVWDVQTPQEPKKIQWGPSAFLGTAKGSLCPVWSTAGKRVAELERLPKRTMAIIGGEMLQEEKMERTGLFRHGQAEGRQAGRGRTSEGSKAPSRSPGWGRGTGRWRRAPPGGGGAAAAGPGSAPARSSVRAAGIPSGDRGRNVSGLAHPAGTREAPGAPRLPSTGPAAAPARVSCSMLSWATIAPKNPSSTAGLILEATATYSAQFYHFANKWSLSHLSCHHLLGLYMFRVGEAVALLGLISALCDT